MDLLKASAFSAYSTEIQAILLKKATTSKRCNICKETSEL